MAAVTGSLGSVEFEMTYYIPRPARRPFAASLIIMAALACGQAAASDTKTINVTLDKASLIRMPEKAQTLIIGNPVIADVTVLKSSGMMVITGKGYGETNLIAVDSAGNPVAESLIRVSGSGTLLIVQRGAERESYSCSPKCMPTIQLGDGKVFGEGVGQVQTRNTLAQPAVPGR